MVSKQLLLSLPSLFNPLWLSLSLTSMSITTSSIDQIQNDPYNQTENMLEVNFFNDSSSFISCNFARLYSETDLQKASMALIITYCVSLVFVLFVGCPMYLAIVHYEHFGGDSQKRSLANMIFTNICIFVILLMMTLYIGIGLRIIFGPMYFWLANVLVGTTILFSSCIILTLLFSIVLKNSQLLKPSLTTSLNDKTLYTVVSFGTLAISAFPAYGVWINDVNKIPIIHFYNGDLVLLVKTPSKRYFYQKVVLFF